MSKWWKTPIILLIMASFAVFLIFPPSPYFINFIIVIEIGMAIVLYLRAVMIKDWSDITTFPTILLLSTIFRIAVNVTTTRRILYDGNPGMVIEDFGHFVVGNNIWIGFVMFIILFIVQFIIAGGAQRISEVAARFALDALQGKQNSIELDLNHNFVNEEEARKRRRGLASEVEFYGNMDGASRFVKGDVIITISLMVINLLAGFVVGMVKMHLSLSQSVEQYTVLTVGDGLVNQICSLLVTVSAGLVMSRVAGEGSNNVMQTIFEEMTKNTIVMYVVGGLLIALGLIMPLPKIPFLFVGGIMIAGGYYIQKKNKKEQENENKERDKNAKEEPKDGQSTFTIGIQLITLVISPFLAEVVKNKEFTERVKKLRKEIEKELGVRVPRIRIVDNVMIPTMGYEVLIKDVTRGKGTIMPEKLLAIPTSLTSENLNNGIPIKEPIQGEDAYWISKQDETEAINKNYHVRDAADLLITHLGDVIERHLHDIIQRKDIQALLDELAVTNQRVLLDEIKVNNIQTMVIQGVIQNLVQNQISVKDFSTIVEGIVEAGHYYENIDDVINYVRREKLSMNICDGILKRYETNKLYAMMIGQGAINDNQILTRDGKHYLAMGKEENELIKEIQNKEKNALITGKEFVLLVQTDKVRSGLEKSLLRRKIDIPVISLGEISNYDNADIVGVINMNEVMA